MSWVVTDDNHYKAIADTIRNKGDNLSITMKPSEMPNNIETVCEHQYDKGYDVGLDEGKQAEYDRFWDMFQQNGNRKGYQNAFMTAWDDTAYNPKYPIVCQSNIYAATGLFSGSTITDTKVPIMIRNTRADTLFQDCVNLKRIPSLTFENLVRFSNTFRNCKALEELNLYGTLDIDGFDVQWSTRLSKSSIESIINALSATTSGLSVTFSRTSVNTAFETSEGAADGSTSAEWTELANTKSNWTINLV